MDRFWTNKIFSDLTTDRPGLFSSTVRLMQTQYTAPVTIQYCWIRFVSLNDFAVAAPGLTLLLIILQIYFFHISMYYKYKASLEISWFTLSYEQRMNSSWCVSFRDRGPWFPATGLWSNTFILLLLLLHLSCCCCCWTVVGE